MADLFPCRHYLIVFQHSSVVICPNSGMPYPQNLKTALEVEAVVASHGAIPATIAIIQGQPCIGLSREELERIAKNGSSVSCQPLASYNGCAVHM